MTPPYKERKQATESDQEMTWMSEQAHENQAAAVLNVFKTVKEKIVKMSKQLGNPSREMETI